MQILNLRACVAIFETVVGYAYLTGSINIYISNVQ